jgi:hypothetical protein
MIEAHINRQTLAQSLLTPLPPRSPPLPSPTCLTAASSSPEIQSRPSWAHLAAPDKATLAAALGDSCTQGLHLLHGVAPSSTTEEHGEARPISVPCGRCVVSGFGRHPSSTASVWWSPPSSPSHGGGTSPTWGGVRPQSWRHPPPGAALFPASPCFSIGESGGAA